MFLEAVELQSRHFATLVELNGKKNDAPVPGACTGGLLLSIESSVASRLDNKLVGKSHNFGRLSNSQAGREDMGREKQWCIDLRGL